MQVASQSLLACSWRGIGILISTPSITKYLMFDFFTSTLTTHLIKKFRIIFYFNYNVVYYIMFLSIYLIFSYFE
jgi:hypothetical protein